MCDCIVSQESTVDPCIQMESQKLTLTHHLNNRKRKVLDSVLFLWLVGFVCLSLFFARMQSIKKKSDCKFQLQQ